MSLYFPKSWIMYPPYFNFSFKCYSRFFLILGIVFNDGVSWSKTRRIVLKYLKSFGLNSRFMENYIGEECRALVKLRTRDAGEPILVNSMFNISIVNILWRLVAGKRSKYTLLINIRIFIFIDFFV